MTVSGPMGPVSAKGTGRPCSEPATAGGPVSRRAPTPRQEARTSVEISVARKRLEEMRDDLSRSIAVLRGEHPLARGGGAEAGDAGANLSEADRNQAAVELATAQRAEVLAALARVDDGSYGRCVDCGNPVPDARLEARPATSRCVPCQSKRDRRRR
jgi:DnaK suppressor protein